MLATIANLIVDIVEIGVLISCTIYFQFKLLNAVRGQTWSESHGEIPTRTEALIYSDLSACCTSSTT